MLSFKHFLNPIIISRLPRFILASHQRYLATEVQPEIGPSVPELQLTNLTGDHQRK
jgi:hypothetical protein